MSKKPNILVSVFCIIGMFLLSGCEGDSGSEDIGDNNPDVYVAFGDSITYGYGDAGTPYPDRLATMIGKTVVNEGNPGETSLEGASRVNSVLSENSPAHLLILYGANDVLRSRDNETIISNLRSIIQAAKGNSTVPELATLTPIPGHSGQFSASVESLNDMIRDLAGEEGVRLVDLESAFEGTGDVDSYMQSDGLHPNDAGTQLIADRFL